jgi:hypothetical protein
MIIGLIYLHKNKKEMAIFVDVLSAVTFFMVMRGTLTYGPSRHMLYMYPVMLYIIYSGIDCLVEKNVMNELCIVVVGMFYLVSFVLSVPGQIVERKNYISEKEIADVVAEYEPDLVYGWRWTGDLYMMDFEGYDNLSEIYGENLGWIKKSSLDDMKVNCLMIISRTTDISGFWDKNVQERYNKSFLKRGFNVMTQNSSTYEIIYKKEIYSSAEVEYASKYYSNYKNGLYMYVLERKEKID